jgi:hypothetical protein
VENGAIQVVGERVFLVSAPKSAGGVAEAKSGVGAPGVVPRFDQIETY